MELKFKAKRISKVGNSYFIRVPMPLLIINKDIIEGLEEINVTLAFENVKTNSKTTP